VPATTVDIVIPVLNEAHVLEGSVQRVREFLARGFRYGWRIVIVDNGSTDGTAQVAEALASRFRDVAFIHLYERGRGRALRFAWQTSRADVCCYMDVDLSTDLAYLEPLIRAVAEDGYGVATGSRLMKGSRVRRSWTREIISRIYNLLLRLVLNGPVSDAQCGFKAASREVIERVVPEVEDQSWFFDTELLVLSAARGFLIKELPIVWNEDDDSRVRILRTAWDDVKGVFRIRRKLRQSRIAPSGASALKTPTQPREPH
jgi:glycosyltransferase involved in cell wall biosynthesis